jgi:integrase
VVGLKVTDVDSERMTLRIEQGKGRRDRYAMLSPVLLERLRAWWRVARAQARHSMVDGSCFICNTSAAHAHPRCCIDRFNPPATVFGVLETTKSRRRAQSFASR